MQLGKFLPRMGAFLCKRDLLISNPFNERIRRYEDLEMLYRVYHIARIYLGTTPVMVVNQDFAAASIGRNDIQEDFLGHLVFKGKTFWERMCLYKFCLGYIGKNPYLKRN